MDAADEASALQLWRGEPDTLGKAVSVTLARIRLHEGFALQKAKRLSELDLATLWLVALLTNRRGHGC